MNLFNIYIPQITGAGSQIQGVVNTTLTVVILICVLLILVEAVSKWVRHSDQEKNYTTRPDISGEERQE